MAFVYDLKANQPDSHQSQPWALILIMRFKDQNTFEGTNPSQAFLPEDQKSNVNENDAVTVDKVLIRSDILSVSVNSSKNSFTGTATAMLVPGQYDYQYVVFPGDHAFIWMNNDIKQLTAVVDAVRSGSPANFFQSGLKFYGRVESCRKVFNTSAQGVKSVKYQLNFKSFAELNSQIYFNPYMKISTENEPNVFFAEVTRKYQDLFSPDGQITPTSMILSLISIFLGNGPGQNAVQSGSVKRSSNNAYIIPKEVGDVFGQESFSNGARLTYADILNTVVGIQKYNDKNTQLTGVYPSFLPQLDNTTTSNRQRVCIDKLQGRFLALPDLFNNTTLWSLLQSYLNTVINEMYLTMRTDENGNIFPTLVARQIPFSTSKITSKNVPNTQFVSLPQWNINNNIKIEDYNIGTSDVARVNFVQFYGQVFNSIIDAATAISEQSGEQNFKEDRLDILRNGGRNMIATSNVIVNTDPNQSPLETADNFSSLIADWYINGHLKLTGTLSLVGIPEPICIGDNIQYDKKIFHIEGVTHRYAMMGIKKSFTTSLDLSNGMDTSGNFIEPLDLSKANIKSTTNERYNTTVETSHTVDQSAIKGPSTPTSQSNLLNGVLSNPNITPAQLAKIKGLV